MTASAASALASARVVLPLRVRGVAYFLDRARQSPDRATLSALCFHATGLRQYASDKHAQLVERRALQHRAQPTRPGGAG